MATQDLNIKIVASDQTGAAFTSVRQKMDGLSTSAVSVAGKIGGLTAALTSIAAVGASIRFVSEMTRQTIALGDALDELSARVNISVTELSALVNSAQFAGISQDELASSIMYLQKSIGEAAIGTKDQALAFRNLGISIRDANGDIRPTVDILSEVADRMAGAQDGAIKLQYQMALFGRSGGQLNEFLNKGGSGLKDFSNVINEEGAKAAATFNDNLDWMGQRVRAWLSEHHGFLDFLNRQFDQIKAVDKAVKAMNGSAGGGRGYVNPNIVTPAAPQVQTTLPNLKGNDELLNKLREINNEIMKMVSGDDAVDRKSVV